MPSVWSTINNSARAILANQRAIDVISHNVANVNTPGYHRQQLVLKAGIPDSGFGGGTGQYGTGVLEDRIERFTWEFLDKRYRLEQAESSKWDKKVEILGEVESSMSELNDGGLIKTMDNFWDSWQLLSTDPTNDALRSNVRENGRQIADAFNRRMESLDAIKDNTDLMIKERVLEINSIATKLAALNKNIGHVISAQQQPNDLLDTRDQLLDRLAEIAGAVSFRNQYVVDEKTGTSFDTGQINVSIGGHILVFDGSSTAGLTYNDSQKTFQWADGQPYNGVNGELTGILQAKDTINAQISGLDNLAHGMVKWVNDIHQTVYQASDPLNASTVDVSLNINGGNFWVGGNGTAAIAESADPNNVMAGEAATAVFSDLRELGTMTYQVETRDVGGQLQFRVKDADGNVVGIDTNGADDAGGNTLTTNWLNYGNGTVYNTGRGFSLTFPAAAVSGENVHLDYTARGIDLTNAADVGGAAKAINATDSLSSIVQKINASKFYQPQGREVEAVVVGQPGSYQLLLTPVDAGASHAVIANSSLTTAGVVPPNGTVAAGAILPFPSGATVATPPKFFEGEDLLGAARNIRLSEEVKADLKNISAARTPLTPGDGTLATQMAAGRYANNFEYGANGALVNANDTYNSQITQLALDISYATNNKNDTSVIADSIKKQREAFVGVNLDEEAVNLIKYQKAFQAAAKIIQTADEMLMRIIDQMKA